MLQYKLYIGKGEEATALIRTYVESNERYIETLKHLLIKYNADSVMIEDGEHTGLIFRRKQTTPYLVPYLPRVGTNTGVFSYKPRIDTSEGIALSRHLAAIEPFSESEFLLDSMGIEKFFFDQETGSDYYCTSAVIVGDKICVAVPDDGKEHEMPSWFQEVSTEEFDRELGNIPGM